MKLLNTILINIISIPFLVGITPVSIADTDKGSAWMLKEIVDYDVSAKIAEYNRKRKGIYSAEASGSRGSYNAKQTYVGPDKGSPIIDRGEHLAVKANWSSPPAVILPGESVELTLSFTEVSKRLPHLHFGNSTRAYFDNAKINPGSGTAGAISLADYDDEYYFKIHRGSSGSINKTVRAAPRDGRKDGDLMGLLITMTTAVSPIGTKYIYEWKAVTEESVIASKNIRATIYPKVVKKSPATVEYADTGNEPGDETDRQYPPPSEWQESIWKEYIELGVTTSLAMANTRYGGGPLIDIYNYMSALPGATKTALILWLLKKRTNAGGEGNLDLMYRYDAYLECLVSKNCSHLKEIQRKEAQ